ncbi:MAG: hypothetical protein ABSG25_09985 [Bryobacteraceae bacterium]
MLKHGHARAGRLTVEYQAWSSMIRRCENPAATGYDRYGARGISVCPRWRASFSAFLADVGMKPGREYSLDRVDNAGNYEPGNVRWTTVKVQARNRRDVPLIEFRGERRSAAEWGELEGLPGTVITGRMRLGWSADLAITTRYAPHVSMTVEFHGRRLTIAELAAAAGVDRKGLLWRIRAGWPLEQAISHQDHRKIRRDEKDTAAGADTPTAAEPAAHRPRAAAAESRG